MQVFVLLACLLGLSAALPFEAHISITDASVNPTLLGASLGVDFSLTNTNPEPMTVVVWGTPLDKSNDILRADMFKVVAESGASAMYTGIVDKRRPTLSDFVTLHPGQTVQARVNLLKGYWFPQQGQYTISLASYVRAFIGEVELESVIENGLENFEIYDLMSSESLFVNIVDITPEPTWGPSYNGLLGAVTVNANCDTSRASTVRTADTQSGTLISRVRTYMGRGCQATGNYLTWMGVCDSSRFSTVTNNFNAINSRWSNGYRVDCAGSSCSANTYAYVFPSDSTYTVYVCGAFWNARAHNCTNNVAQWDTQSGTIIHEISHFSNVAGTSDIQYGTSGCQTLAKNNPSQAVRNADSHEYLAESCP